MAGSWNKACYLFLLLPCTVFILRSCIAQVAPESKQAEIPPESKGPYRQSRVRQRAYRDYSDVDPSFKVSLEGSMSGGQRQVEAEEKMASEVHSRLERMLNNTKTEECREKVIRAYQHYIGAQVLERTLPFEGKKFVTQCQDATKRPEVPESGLIPAEDVRLAYVILAHDEPAQVVRLVNTLDDEVGKNRTWFIIHIDTKAEDSQQELLSVFQDRPNVIVMEEGRQDVAWGGFNVVQASLNAVGLALARGIPFHWLWILSGTTYPIASNDAIRAKLASHHPESIFMESKPSPHKPASTTWHYYIECDSALHRIGRNLPPRDMEMYVGSQWLAMPPAAAKWLMEDALLVPNYRDYARHIVVADENFLPTMLRNSPFCSHLVSSNLVHVQFDRYEHTLEREARRTDKCLMPNPDHCGRSPATMTVDYLSVLEHSGMLFARKFDPKDQATFDVLDRVRDGQQPWRAGALFYPVSIQWEGRMGEPNVDEQDGTPLCLQLNEIFAPQPNRKGSSKSEALFVPCNETDSRQIMTLGPCSSDGSLELAEGGNGHMKSARGEVSNRAPSCSVRSGAGSCMDLLGEAKGPGASVIAYKCHNRWNQFFSFGEGDLTGHIMSTVPGHLAMADEVDGAELCLKVKTERHKTVVKTAKCSADSEAQKFRVVQITAEVPEEASIPREEPGEASATSSEACAPGDETCTAPEL